MSKSLLTTQQAAAELGVNDSRVRQLIRSGDLKAQQFGRAYLLEPAEVRKLVGKIGNEGKIGRPPKQEPSAPENRATGRKRAKGGPSTSRKGGKK